MIHCSICKEKEADLAIKHDDGTYVLFCEKCYCKMDDESLVGVTDVVILNKELEKTFEDWITRNGL